ncbi:transcriptional regulatory protein [Nocardiopsis terrae]|uniref:Two-component system CitB family response regulator n=1 Tax=Nocardiopsis terrae TaxID=372655 RepID=A0ABR9HIL1_9ACTN|nr:two-component system CitB family response regulator [Nocardiopsis terrae]GHC86812.1 transcriptional regulatory protein [Nocardiopsis terrae]
MPATPGSPRPQHTVRHTPNGPEATPEDTDAQVRTLIVDDDFMVARVHRGLVERVPGFTVVGEAGTGAEALDMVARSRPDLVLLDIYLPDMNGIEVLRALRASGGEGLPEVDALVITAARDSETVRHALRGGAVQYLIKPFEPALLTERLRDYARLRRDLATGDAADQDAVDRAFGAARPVNRSAKVMPKGLTSPTAELVERALRTRAARSGGTGTEDLSATECAAATGISRVSARRYLEHFAESGRVEVRLRYGTAGRPERRYRWSG